MRVYGPVFGLLLGFAVGACLEDPHKACHQQVIARLGCCPACQDECSVAREDVEVACGDALDDAFESEDGGPMTSSEDGPSLPEAIDASVDPLDG